MALTHKLVKISIDRPLLRVCCLQVSSTPDATHAPRNPRCSPRLRIAATAKARGTTPPTRHRRQPTAAQRRGRSGSRRAVAARHGWHSGHPRSVRGRSAEEESKRPRRCASSYERARIKVKAMLGGPLFALDTSGQRTTRPRARPCTPSTQIMTPTRPARWASAIRAGRRLDEGRALELFRAAVANHAESLRAWGDGVRRPGHGRG